MERIRFSNLSEFLQLSRDDQEYEYTVAWIDCLARGELWDADCSCGVIMSPEPAGGSLTRVRPSAFQSISLQA